MLRTSSVKTHTQHTLGCVVYVSYFSSVSLFTYRKQESIFAFKKMYIEFICFYLKVEPNDKQAVIMGGSVGDMMTTWFVMPTEPHGCPAVSVFI